ncbi:SAM-dependent methyltransferase [Ramlibacter pallidus]|uniref:Class I SAM-dependent methyltransferase n=1 Tax=Ramlibacter pallidus TaxID=2780087 RepID=A0ABR9RZR2_9BURK|nr:methyltransferase domain-containing protein [Ramlibacter pallidus]MBE7366743.1 class I SAM-dependent methyltransferase [Ramlibacter pallidus]
MKRSAFTLLAGLLFAGAPHAQPTEEVPFITSPDNVTLEMLGLARVGPSDHVIDLGSGDGRIVITAARRFGASGLGVEIVPDLVQQSQRNAREAGVADRVAFREQDLFRTDLAPATVITMYLLPEVNLQLRPALLALKPGTRVVSHDWDMGDWKPDRTTVVPVPDKKVGLEKSSKVHLWVVPARVDGLWCAPPLLGGGSLEFTQSFQQVQGRLARRGRVREGTGRLDGTLLHLETTGDRAMLLEVAGDTLRLADTSQPLPAGTVLFTRARSGSC